MTERTSKNDGLLQVQYAFLELPKVPAARPTTGGADLWAWLFVNAPHLTEVPSDLSAGPHRAALELANQSQFTQEELQAYERVRDEIRQVIEIAAARWADGKAEGRAEGKAEGLAEGRAAGLAEGKLAGETAALARTILSLLSARGLPVSAEARSRIESCADVPVLERWILRAATASTTEEVLADPK
ncbi:MAG: hypothetical protein R3F14_02140 [Polyangiaceae bacterium]